ncbi:beta-galactosidase GalA [Asticcacaulis sp. 201]|uniref:beta-galactosidase GalA n=1 Tax=Asticcacaulis sp. 201 TaxID=3028787 RepID=UPI002916827A|nr:beta-galactosidase GalA [Asticcacaulis sp. 201]MDV6332206.1 beta-galactosidase GalA [Asticcacaulis sp. 201]
MLDMNRRHLLASAAATFAAVSAGLPALAQTVETGQRRRLRFDTGWKFAFGHLNDVEKDFGFGADLRTYAKQGPDATPIAKPDYDDSTWRGVTLPHDWAVELPFVPNPKAATFKPDDHGSVWDPAANHGFKPLGRDYPDTSVGWYRKTFTLDASDAGKRISLEFDGVFRNAMVIVNGYILKVNDSGYSPFRVELNDVLNTDDKPNTVLVRVDASLGEGWFYEGAGIYRHVWLVKTDPVHVPQYGVRVRAKTDGTVEVATTVKNDSDQARTIDILSGIRSLTGDVVSANTAPASVTLAPWSQSVVSETIQVSAPKLWSLEQPNLYTVTTTLRADQTAVDRVSTTFGFRDIRFDAKEGFFLNGKSVKLKGTCNHQDHAGVGAAIPDALQVWRLQQLKDMGCNAYRTSHNPPTPELLDVCDRMGILVIDETRMMASSEEGLAQLETLILRDRNHPSVILWSIGNEEPQQGTKRGAKIARTMKRLCNDLDPTRLVTAAMDNGYGQGITEVIDVMGFNYRDGVIDDFHAKFPNMPIIGTETASTVATRGEYIKDDAAHIVPAYDTTAPWWATTAEGWWPHFDEKPYIAGGFIWTGFDYRGEPTPYSSWPSISSQFGALDTCGFPKDNYWYYRAWWRPEPLLHLFPHWNWEGKEGQDISVWAHSNADAVELFVNGKSAGRKAVVKNRHVEWTVPYQPGKIEAYAYKAGKVILKAARETAGAPAKVVLTTDRTALSNDGMDCTVIKAEVFDAKGRPVPKADSLVRFTVSGPGAVIGVGNGNPNSHEADKASERKAFNGLCCAIVQVTGAGAITVTASADGLAGGKLVLKSA